jgi:hypothetical protein
MAARVSDNKIITAIALCGSITNAAASLGLSTSAIYQRLKNSPELRNNLNEIQSTAIIAAASTLTDAAECAINTLREICENTGNPATVRVSAADSILRHAARYSETANIIPRIEGLEQAGKERS